METKTYSLVMNANCDQARFVLGRILGDRHQKEQSIVYVFGDAKDIPQALLSYTALDEKEILERGIAVHIGVTNVESTVRLLESTPYDIHVVFYMPGHFSSYPDGFGGVELGLPVLVRSDAVRRIIRNLGVDAVTIFVDKE